MSEFPILDFLTEQKLSFELFRHPPVFTVEEGVEVMKHIPGTGTKNLFLCDGKKSRYFLLTVREDKRVNLKELSLMVGLCCAEK